MPTTFDSATQLTATVDAALVAIGGTASVTVFSPPPGGGTSNAATFTVNNPVPDISGLSPGSQLITAGSLSLTGLPVSADSPSTSHRIQSDRHGAWLEARGVRVPRTSDAHVDALIEISPLTALEPADLAGVELPAAVEAGDELVL